MDIDTQIKVWHKKNTKLKKFDEFKKINKYIDNYNLAKKLTKKTHTLNYSSDYEFEYYDLDNMDIKQMMIRPENIFKLNFLIITKKIKKYFSRLNFPGLKIKIYFEKAGIIDSQLKIPQSTYKHDVYIRIEYYNNANNDYKEREIGLEYFEVNHDRIKDKEKQISSEIQLESYIIYQEKDKKYCEFMKIAIYEIFLNICCVLYNKYILSKIIYFENYIKNKNILQDTLIFNKMIEWKRNDKFNFEEFFFSIRITDPNNDKYFQKCNEFIEFLKTEHNITIILDKNNCCEFELFETIINVVNSDCSKIYDYRKTLTKMMKIMVDASDKILLLCDKSNQNKQNLPNYISNFLNLHILNLKNKKIIMDLHCKLENKLKK